MYNGRFDRMPQTLAIKIQGISLKWVRSWETSNEKKLLVVHSYMYAFAGYLGTRIMY